jgi:predicted  nucleic acid-binding Zn-ribbon protein
MMADLSDEILVKLGELSSSVNHLLRDFGDEKTAARDSRAAVHRRLDEYARDLSDLRTELSTSIAIAGEVSAQAREEAKEVKAKIDNDLGPAIAEWTRIKNMGLGMAVLIGIGGAAMASAVWVAVTYFGDAIAAAIRKALGIP